MSIVVDASAVASLYFPDERPANAREIVETMIGSETLAPSLLWYEIRATALKKERRRILSAAVIDDALRQIRDLPISLVNLADETSVLTLARRYTLTFYDCSYLALAVTKGAKLVTLDKRLAVAARAEGVLFES